MLDVILWDYDGTIADSVEKNYYVTLKMLETAVPRLFESRPAALRSPESFFRETTKFENWRELYRESYGMTGEEVERAGAAWAFCQQETRISPRLFDGIADVIKGFQSRKQGVISQNSSGEIRGVLKQNGVDGCMDYVCGYTDVPQFSPKPHPAPFWKCVERMEIDPAAERIAYVGDHEEDVRFCENIRAYYRERGIRADVISVAVSYSGSAPSTWAHRPDHIAESVEMLAAILQKIDRTP